MKTFLKQSRTGRSEQESSPICHRREEAGQSRLRSFIVQRGYQNASAIIAGMTFTGIELTPQCYLHNMLVSSADKREGGEATYFVLSSAKQK